MEESGARIWIDQDSMGTLDPRILYISGSRKNVDIAVGLLSDLVLKYQPLPSPHARQVATTPLGEKTTAIASTTKGPSMPEASDVPVVPLKPKMGPYISSYNGVGTTGEGRSKHVLSCDPRFVPLLIGRRGWTIKNIQDTTGAKVDIDQSVTPRKITISGSEGNVEKAIRMVQDVLSYPHAQLHGFATDDNNMDDAGRNMFESISISGKGNDRVSDIVIARTTPTEEIHVTSDLAMNATTANVPRHSPPSSLIMTGEPNSTISASSSLSSTPEPVLPSSRAQIPPIDIGPTTFSPQQQNRDVFSSVVEGLPQGALNQITHQSPLPSTHVFHSQGTTSFYDSVDPKIQRNNLQQNMNATHSLHQRSPNPVRPNFLPDCPSSFLHMQNQTHASIQRPIAFQPSQNSFGAAVGPVDPQRSAHNSFLQNENGLSGVVGPGFWNDVSTSRDPMHRGLNTMPQHLSTDGFHLDAAVDFLEHSKQLHTKPQSMVGDMNNIIGFSGPSAVHDQTIGSVHNPILDYPKGRDDAQMVDSLFGPLTTPSSGDAILSGLQGLSLHREESIGLWGSSDPLTNSSSLQSPGSDRPLLFGERTATQPTAERKSESRFVWGESGHF
jgi:KH domain